MGKQVERLTQALADRYTIERELGAGGMATVYLAEDEKHNRKVAIKVMRPELTAIVGGERFLREITIAAKLNHPHILALHDSGQIEEFLYYVMPHVQGESLRTKLTREKQLSVDEAIAITRQIGGALNFAHEQGVIHRDIKPENILLYEGEAMVADFGIALAVSEGGGERLTETGFSMGTLGYMSPEQALDDVKVDARADQYSLACLLFEMLAGEPPFPGQTIQSILVRQMTESPPSLTDMREAVPVNVAEAVRKALSKTPADRYATVAQFADALKSGGPKHSPVSTPGARPVKPRRVRWIATISVALAVLAVAIFASVSQPVEFERRGFVLVADFDNTTGDTIFDGTLDRAFAIALQQSRHVNVYPRTQVDDVLELMGMRGVDRITADIAREVATRRSVRVVVVPSISQIGSVYSLGVTVVDPETGETFVSRSEETSGKDEVIPAVGKLASRVRRDLGESLAALLGARIRLDAATTPSLEALRAWSAGNRQWRQNNLEAARNLYLRALEFDSNFAMAHTDLGQFYYWARSDRVNGDYHFDKALELSGRVTHRERLGIEASVAGWRGNRDHAVSTYRVLLADYPDDAIAWSNLGYQYLMLRRPEGAIEAYTNAIALDSLNDNSMVNLATVYNGQDNFDSALIWYDRAFTINPSYRVNTNLNGEFGNLYIKLGDFAKAEEVFSWMLSESPAHRSRGNRSFALLRMRQGRYLEAIDHLRRSVVLDEDNLSAATRLRARTYLANALLTTGRRAEARSELRAIHRLADTSAIAPFFMGILGRLEVRAGLVDLARTALDTLLARSQDGNTGDEAVALMVEGELAMANGQPDSAIRLFKRSSVLRPQPEPLYLEGLGIAQTMVGDDEGARSTFENLAAARNRTRESQEPWVLSHYHLARLYDEAGLVDRAVEMYGLFLDLWEAGDEDLEYITDARVRLTALTQTDRPTGQ